MRFTLLLFSSTALTVAASGGLNGSYGPAFFRKHIEKEVEEPNVKSRRKSGSGNIKEVSNKVNTRAGWGIPMEDFDDNVKKSKKNPEEELPHKAWGMHIPYCNCYEDIEEAFNGLE